MWDDLWPLLAAAAATLGVTTFVQLWIVPRVETRKRDDDRWERDVRALGELLSFDYAEGYGAARSALIGRVFLTENSVTLDADTLAHFKVEDERTLRAAREHFGRVCDQVEWLSDQVLSRDSTSKSLAALARAHMDFVFARTRLNIQLTADWDTALSREEADALFSSMHSATRSLRKSVKDLARRPPPRRPGVLRRSLDWLQARREGLIYRRNTRVGESDLDPTSQLEEDM